MPGQRGRLLRKYVLVFAGLVTVALLASGLIEIYFSYQEKKEGLVALQHEKALGAASRIESFVKEIERQLGWTTQPHLVAPTAALEQRRIDSLRLLRQVPAITELSHLDPSGREQLRVSRLAMDVVGSGIDLSADPKFFEPKAGKTYFGPVYFRKESEPYMTIAMPQSGGGVTVAEVNLKFIWDVVSQIKIGKAGRAYVVDSRGTLIAHPDISLVLQKTTMAGFDQVKTALAAAPQPSARPEAVTIAQDLQGRQVLTAYSVIQPLRWAVFVEQPQEEAFEPLRASVQRTVALLLAGVGLAAVAGLLLARRMVRPIREMQAGAAKIGAGELGHRIDVKSGDELEALADQFNRMTEQLQESYATLEQKVEERTRDLTEALEQQTATSEILHVISSSPTDLQPVFDTILEKATRLCEAELGLLVRYDGDAFHAMAFRGATPAFVEYMRQNPVAPSPLTALGRIVRERRPIHIADLMDDEAYRQGVPARVKTVELAGARTFLAVPMLKEGNLVGAIVIYRREVRPFGDKQIALVTTFASQAVIAIENVRLFTELQEKNREVTEALEQQTATGEILSVISGSPTDVQPVFDSIVQSATRLCDGVFAGLLRRDGELIHLAAHHNFGPEAVEAARAAYPMPVTAPELLAEVIREGRLVHMPDIHADPRTTPEMARMTRSVGARSHLIVPLLREGATIGALVVARAEIGPFSDRQIALLKTFADQAVIAIENVRLFQELEARNRDLTEALAQQTATSEILRVISSSPTNVQPVFDTILANALRLCEAHNGGIFTFDGQGFRIAAAADLSDEFLAYLRGAVILPGRETPLRRVGLEPRVSQVADILADPSFSPPEVYRREGMRTSLAVPMVKEGRLVGAFAFHRRQVRPFAETQIALLKTFADQAVIAVENVRLFKELQERTRELGRTVDQLRALSAVGQTVSSTLDLARVLPIIVEHAGQLSGSDGASIYEYDERAEVFHLRASRNLDPDLVETLRAIPIRVGQGALGRAAATRGPVQYADIAVAGAYTGPLRDALLRAGFRAVLAVPLLREDQIVGGLTVNRSTPGEFAPETVELLKTFGTQSALAIQNARLFREIEDKSRQLEVADRHKSEFLANMSHELRTPLNAIIGFSEVLIERMFGEVNDKQDEYLRDIFSSGKHLLSLINDILDLSKIEAGRMDLEVTTFDLPMAIDNALTLVRTRAENHGITLETAIDQRLGEFVGDERKFKQVLVNLLSNAVKFTPEGGRVGVRAAPANGSVEVSVTDTGIGIAPQDHEAIFEEFRQVGADHAGKREGTGLGLTLTRKFIELHGGKIWVKSAPGKGSTFTFTLPVRPWPTS